MKAMACDRCSVVGVDDGETLHKWAMISVGSAHDPEESVFDLCAQCTEELFDFIKLPGFLRPGPHHQRGGGLS
jgi:hypothetical protein